MVIKFNRIATFLGRNGYFKSKGLLVSVVEPNVYLTPMTTKNLMARCEIAIPKENTPAVAAKLLEGMIFVTAIYEDGSVSTYVLKQDTFLPDVLDIMGDEVDDVENVEVKKDLLDFIAEIEENGQSSFEAYSPKLYAQKIDADRFYYVVSADNSD